MKRQQKSTVSFATNLARDQKSRSYISIDRNRCHRLLNQILSTLFPHYRSTRKDFTAKQITQHLKGVERELQRALTPMRTSLVRSPAEIAQAFTNELPEIYRTLLNDAEAIFKGDPAAHSTDEVIIAYPGFFAIAAYRVAHTLHTLKIPIIPRVLSEYAHERTGIDIHPGASIGSSFFIDHGTGIVVGESTIIRDNVKLYQGVTLGALSVAKSKANTKRHPTIESDVVVYSNATILGGDTVVGKGSIIGGNVWLTRSVPEGSTVYHESVVTVKSRRTKG